VEDLWIGLDLNQHHKKEKMSEEGERLSSG
jgi:hypothetical protein